MQAMLKIQEPALDGRDSENMPNIRRKARLSGNSEERRGKGFRLSFFVFIFFLATLFYTDEVAKDKKYCDQVVQLQRPND